MCSLQAMNNQAIKLVVDMYYVIVSNGLTVHQDIVRLSEREVLLVERQDTLRMFQSLDFHPEIAASFNLVRSAIRKFFNPSN